MAERKGKTEYSKKEISVSDSAELVVINCTNIFF